MSTDEGGWTYSNIQSLIFVLIFFLASRVYCNASMPSKSVFGWRPCLRSHAKLVDPIRPYMMEIEHMSLLP
jgi:hypothetical protein